uniref:Uncharacterized protein n=1 Tax=Solanum lycopersicum TaxID=4081 RepID=A0A3Q7FL42_SOLLC
MENVIDFKSNLLIAPNSIKKIMKTEKDVRMIADESPENHQYTLKKDDVTDVIRQTDPLDYLLDNDAKVIGGSTPSVVSFYAAGGSNGST